MSSNAATLIVTAAPDPDRLDSAKAYLTGVFPLLLAAGGEIVKRAKVTDTVVGEADFAAYLVMDFPSADHIRDLFAGEDYAELVPHRDRGFRFMNIMISEAN